MNRALLITFGILIILVMIAVWVYLMFFGVPKSSTEVFAKLGYHSTSQPVTITPPTASTTPVTAPPPIGTKQVLRQLTTRAVAGFAFVTSTTSSSSELVRYVERGTGHVYDIDLTTGAETLISGTTIPAVSEADFSPDGRTIALTSYAGYNRTVFVGTLNDQSLTGTNLPTGAQNIAFMNNQRIAYTLSIGGTTRGYEQDLDTGAASEDFSVKFENISVAWGSDVTGIYVFTKPTQGFPGYMYQVKRGALTPVGGPAFGLTALFSDHDIIESYIHNNIYTSADLAQKTNLMTPMPILALPSKCSFAPQDTNTLWCASPLTDSFANDVLTKWYEGTYQFSDYIWRVNLGSGQAALYADPQSLAKTTLDVEDTAVDPADNYFLVRNKPDDTLWLIDLTAKS